MKPVRSVKNQYLGINAHLHSYWQAEHKWNRFHNAHIVHLTQMLRAQLLPMGYTAEIEESLQIRRIGDDLQRPRADVILFDLDPVRAANSELLPATAVIELEAIDQEDIEHPYSAIVVYEHNENFDIGVAVAWVEILSPTNKGRTEDAYVYRAKRRLLLEKGVVFAEIDYLHETPPTFNRLGDYTLNQPRARPYRIVIVDPRPEYKKAKVFLYEFDVDMPLPTVVIPLNAADRLKFDFGAPYRRQFEEMLHGLQDVDYAQFPLNFDRYSPDDQARIASRMVTVLEKAQQAIDLETGPFAAEPLALDEALARIAALTNA